jgi:hypothetical protein
LLATHFFLPAEHLFRTGVGYPGSRSVTTSSTKSSTRLSSEPTSPVVAHGGFVSVFWTQPFDGVAPPSNLSSAFVTHNGSTATPFPSALLWQPSSAVAFVVTHFIFAAVHFAVADCASARSPPKAAVAASAANSTYLLMMLPP